ncbi:MAG: DUF4382 domain-containing protein [Comamonadaceae bacterium]|nr:DUF4382 domain-containing protein [Comamonadaceae bacterium]
MALLAACGGGGGDGSSASNPTGRLKLSVTDAPVDDAQAVWVQFRAVEFKPEGAEPVRQDLKDANGAAAPQRINLLPLQDGRAAVLLDGVVLPAGRYEWLRLLVDNEPNVRDSYIEVAGNECELRIPSGDESGLKLIRGFTLPEQGALALTVDFDLRKSIHAPPGQQGSGMNCTQAYHDEASVAPRAGRRGRWHQRHGRERAHRRRGVRAPGVRVRRRCRRSGGQHGPRRLRRHRARPGA